MHMADGAGTRDWVLSVDEGTTNAKAVLVSAGGVRVSKSAPVDVVFPRAGWVEQDPRQLLAATASVIRDCLEGGDRASPACLAITNQRESVVAWHRTTGEPVGPVLGWQDARTAPWCAELAAMPGVARLVRERTGLALDPMFSAPKITWLLDAAGAARSQVLVGTIDSWLIWQLTGEHVIEAGNASRTMLMDLATLDWDEDLLDLFRIPRSSLPQVLPSDAEFGRTDGSHGVPQGIPVAAVLADSHAALYQHGCTTPGTGKATYGTGSSVMSPCDGLDAAPHGIATTVAWVVRGSATYAREGNILASGAALDWMASLLGCPPGEPGGAFCSELAETVADSGGASFVPAFSGLGSPFWDRSATGIITGITGGTTPAHLARAALAAVAHQVADVVEALESDGRARIDVLHADGGATASDLLMQLQADVLGRSVRRAYTPEASALGVARLAAERLGLPLPPAEAGVLVPPHDPRGRLARLEWADAVGRSRGLAIEQVAQPSMGHSGPAEDRST